ncbi:hypothetical protein FIBSPDRAFT_958272 [Athelia psychrophila]|uniref:Uncharacterized protein n=1 Tax=Athelia psychrophila TaxID=1759441 RepID=A0A166ET78_9AGAM|nr:hypothetical protein FIBSPDRAFT_958272 [Fibularhizoctonia sp. CBS 109695]
MHLRALRGQQGEQFGFASVRTATAAPFRNDLPSSPGCSFFFGRRAALSYRRGTSQEPSRAFCSSSTRRATSFSGSFTRDSSGKWGHVARLLRLGCTQGKWSYEEAIKAERARARAGVDVDKALAGHQWVLPATEDEWAALELEYEKKMEDAKLDVSGGSNAEKDGAGNGGKDVDVDVDVDVGKVLLGNGRPAEHVIRARVKEWQRELTAADASPPPPLSSPSTSTSAPVPLGKLASVENISHEGASVPQPRPRRTLRAGARPASVPAKKGAAVAERAKSKTTGRVQVVQQQPAQLGFPVVKRASATSVGSKPSQERKEKEKEKGGAAKGKEKEKEKEKEPVPPLREEAEDEREVEESMRLESADEKGALPTPQIHDVSEMSFLPPSFPSNMATSTPNPRASSRKPASIPKIPRAAPPSSSPLSSPPDYEGMPPPRESPKRPTKRARESIVNIPVPANVFRDSGSEAVWFPPAKKARVEIEPEPAVIEQEQEQEQEQERPRPSTPKPSTPKERVRTLPTLTELLASSKLTPNTKSAKLPTKPFKAFVPPKDTTADPGEASASPASKAVTDTGLGASKAAAAHPIAVEPPHTPDPSPSKSMFSFASGSTASPGGHYAPPRSPSSPLLPLSFTQNPGLFAPQAMSSQPGGAGARSLDAGSSGFLGGAGFYNSQFDADRAAGRASALLEKDVNFDLWLKSDEEGDDDENGAQDGIEELEAEGDKSQ